MAHSKRNYTSTAVERTLQANMLVGSTTLTLDTDTGIAGLAMPFTLVIDPDVAGKEEVITVLSRGSGYTWTVNRGSDGTTEVDHSTGSKARHMITARDLQEPQNHIDASGAYTIANPDDDAAVTTTNITVPLHGIASGEGYVVGTAKTQTLTNKTLTSPKINENVALTSTSTQLNYVSGVTSDIQTQLNAKAPIASPTFTGTVTIPAGASISGFAPLASPTFTGTVTLPTGTVTSGMILDGTIVDADINSAAAIAQTKIAGMDAWQTWTPTLTNFTAGTSPTTDYKYTQIGKTVICKFNLTAGTSPTMTNAISVSLPVTAKATGYFGNGYVTQSSTAYTTQLWNNSTTTVSLFNVNAAAASYANVVATATNVPATSWWVAGSTISFTFIYEAA